MRFWKLAAAMLFVIGTHQSKAETFCSSGSFEGMNFLLASDQQANNDYTRRTLDQPPEKRRRAELLRENEMSNRGSIVDGSIWTSLRAQQEYQKCKVGEVIFIPASSKSVVAVLCDFSKTIANVGPNVICVMVEERKAH